MVRVTNRELRRRVRKILLKESYSTASLISRYDIDINSRPTYAAQGELATEIMNAIINNTMNFGQVFEVVMARILEVEKTYSCVDLNPSFNSGDDEVNQGGANSEFADIAATKNGSAKSDNYSLQDLADTVLISAKSVKGPFEFNGSGAPEKLVKLAKRILSDSALESTMPVDGILLNYAPAYAALDLKSTQQYKRLVYDVQIALPRSANGKIISRSLTNVKTGVDTTNEHVKKVIFDNLHIATAGKGSKKKGATGATDSYKAILGYLNYALDYTQYNLNNTILGKPRTGTGPNTFFREVNLFLNGGPRSSQSGAARDYQYDKIEKGELKRRKNPERVEEIGQTIQNWMNNKPDITGELTAMYSEKNRFIRSLQDPEGIEYPEYFSQFDALPASPDDFINENVESKKVNFASNLYENIIFAYTKKVFYGILNNYKAIEQMLSKQAAANRRDKIKNSITSIDASLNGLDPLKIYEVILRNTPIEKMQLHEESIGLKTFYMSKVKNLAEQPSDLSSDENVVQPVGLKSTTIPVDAAQTLTVDNVLGSTTNDWALCGLNSNGEIIKMGTDIDPVSNFTSFLTSLMTSGYEYNYYKIIVDIDPDATKAMKGNPSELDRLYYKAIENVVASAKSRLMPRDDKAATTKPRRQYNVDISKAPSTFNAANAESAFIWIRDWYNDSFKNVPGVDNSKLSRLANLLSQLAAPSTPTNVAIKTEQEATSRINLIKYIQEEIIKETDKMRADIEEQLKTLKTENIASELLNDMLPNFRLTILKHAHTIAVYAELNPTEVNKFLDDQIEFLKPFVEVLSESDEQMPPPATDDNLPNVMVQQPLDQVQQVQTESRIYENILKKILYTAKKRR